MNEVVPRLWQQAISLSWPSIYLSRDGLCPYAKLERVECPKFPPALTQTKSNEVGWWNLVGPFHLAGFAKHFYTPDWLILALWSCVFSNSRKWDHFPYPKCLSIPSHEKLFPIFRGVGLQANEKYWSKHRVSCRLFFIRTLQPRNGRDWAQSGQNDHPTLQDRREWSPKSPDFRFVTVLPKTLFVDSSLSQAKSVKKGLSTSQLYLSRPQEGDKCDCRVIRRMASYFQLFELEGSLDGMVHDSHRHFNVVFKDLTLVHKDGTWNILDNDALLESCWWWGSLQYDRVWRILESCKATQSHFERKSFLASFPPFKF